MGVFPIWKENMITPGDLNTNDLDKNNKNERIRLMQQTNKTQQQNQDMITKPPFSQLDIDADISSDIYSLPHGLKFIPTLTSGPETDYLFVTSMNDVCPRETKFFQKNRMSQIQSFESDILIKFSLREKEYLKKLGIGSLGTLNKRNYTPHRQHLGGVVDIDFLQQKNNLISPDESFLEAKFEEIEALHTQNVLHEDVDVRFINRFRRIVGLEFLSRLDKPVHIRVMNTHLISQIINSMEFIRKYPEVKQASFNHFSGSWQNTLSLLVAFNKTSYACLKSRASQDNTKGKYLEQDNNPWCLDVPTLTSEIDFELSVVDTENAQESNRKDYNVRVVYKGETLGLCVDSNTEYSKEISHRVFKTYCPLDEFISLMAQQVILPNYQLACSVDTQAKLEKNHDLWIKLVKEAKYMYYIFGYIFSAQFALVIGIFCFKLKSNKNVAIEQMFNVFDAEEKSKLNNAERSLITRTRRLKQVRGREQENEVGYGRFNLKKQNEVI